MRIVIADDEALTRRVLRATLSAGGHEVLEAADGEMAWALLQESAAAILISDWRMPRLDGPGLIRRIRDAAQPGYTYCILLTARDSKADTVAGLDCGADDYLTKPCHPDELRARVAIGARILALEASLREARDAFAYQASHDALTGLLNRQAVNAHVQAELARAERTASPFSLALLDLDHFKAVNDTYGHLVGDQALRHVAQLLTSAVRPYDWVGRWGGEEFLVALANTGRADARTIAERLRVQIAATPLHLAHEASLPLTVSIGITSVEPPLERESDLTSLFQQADDALYAAKRRGRNQVCDPHER